MFSLVVTFHRKHEGLGNRLSQMYLQSTTKTFKNEDVAPNPKPWGFTVGFGGRPKQSRNSLTKGSRRVSMKASVFEDICFSN